MPKTHTFTFPTIAGLTDEILSHWESMHALATDGEVAPVCDIRVWATSSERIGLPSAYGVEFGDAQYDLVRGDIGADESIDLSDTPDEKEARTVARRLVAQLYDARAEYQEYHRTGGR